MMTTARRRRQRTTCRRVGCDQPSEYGYQHCSTACAAVRVTANRVAKLAGQVPEDDYRRAVELVQIARDAMAQVTEYIDASGVNA